VSVVSAAIPKDQQAIVQTGVGGPEVLKLQTIPVLSPGDGQVLIRVYAAAVNPTDWKTRNGLTPGSGPVPHMSDAHVPGLDVAGVVVKLGAGVRQLKVGEHVFSMIGRGEFGGLNGGYSQFVLAPAENVVAKPKNLSFAEAAGLGVAGMTGARTVDQSRISAGQRVLITGVAGGVGSTAAQIAIARGAHVIGTASAQHAQFLRSIGVTEVIDYTQTDWAGKATDVDVVIDTVGGDTALAAFGTLKKGGTFISVVGRNVTPDQCAAAQVNCVANGVPGSAGVPAVGDLLREVAQLAAAGKLTVHVDRAYPLAQAADAQELNRAGHTEGKVILTVTSGANSK
jgi:NADPH:quinone reductase-like Zn-dependent oxidoreductase